LNINAAFEIPNTSHQGYLVFIFSHLMTVDASRPTHLYYATARDNLKKPAEKHFEKVFPSKNKDICNQIAWTFVHLQDLQKNGDTAILMAYESTEPLVPAQLRRHLEKVVQGKLPT
jgi:hypothetical protein